MLRRKIFAIAGILMFTICFPYRLQAQDTGKIEGYIKQNTHNEGVIGANVYLEGTKFGASTNAAGFFVINEIPQGNYILVVRSLGFESFRVNVAVDAEEPVKIDAVLKESYTELQGVVVERIMLTGGNAGLQDIPGSAHYISPKDLDRFSYNDVNRTLRSIPGINIQEEDGFGLRPNIGMRGTGVERSSKIVIMEDGILTAPAPYAAPAAYYFPRVGRMQAVEIRKGSSQIKYGPYTTGGAINFISTQIPTDLSGKIDLLGGNFGSRSVHANIGDSNKNFGFLAETFQASSDGFKHLPNGDDTGFDIKDYLFKFRVNTNPTAPVYQSLTFKFGQSDEESNETYLGLTDLDFEIDPYQRYAASQNDLMSTSQKQYSIKHIIRPAKFMDISTTFYRTEFARNWYKLDKVKANEDNGKVGISGILANPNDFSEELAVIRGGTGALDDALHVKANNREYYAEGIQSVIGFQFKENSLSQNLELGVRFHQDQIDRFQWVDLYRMQDGVMQLTEAGQPGTESNRVETANAFASFVEYTFGFNRLTFTPGLRYENIKVEREDYGKNDPERTGADLSQRENSVDVFIPGIGINYQVNERLSSFFGVHKGFAPPGSKEGTDPEESVNYEWGVRYTTPKLLVNAVLFYNDYSNLLGSDLAASGGTGSTDQFNGGAAQVLGLEFQATTSLFTDSRGNFKIPLNIAYTYTDGTFESNFDSEFEAWGTVANNDELPYLAKHQLSADLIFEHKRFNVNLSSKFIGDIRTNPGQGDIPQNELIESQYVIDLSSNYKVTKNVNVFGAINNLTDEVYAVSRRPAGLRPGLERNFLVGIKARF